MMRPVDLDRRVLPDLAERLRGLLATGAAARRRVRAVPRTVMVLVVVLLFALGGGLAAVAAYQPPPPAACRGFAAAGQVASIGPQPGDAVPAYVAAARHRLAELARCAPDRPTYAVVDFTGYLTAQQAGSLLGRVSVARAYFRVPAPGVDTQVHSVPLDSWAQLPQQLAATARVEKQAVTSFRQLLAVLGRATTADQQVLVRRYRQLMTAAATEAARLGPACSCVFAAVVRADAAALQAIADGPDTRVVDPAPPGVPVEGVGVAPLLPEDRTTVATRPPA